VIAAVEQLAGRPSPQPSPNGPNGRGADGRFTAGNRCGRGNPNARKVAQLKRTFLGAATGKRMRQLADKLFEQALAGDVAAARLALEYVVGKPSPAVDPDRLDLAEVQQLLEGPRVVDLLHRLADRMPAGDLVKVARAIAEDRRGAYERDGNALDADRMAKMISAALRGGEGGGDG